MMDARHAIAQVQVLHTPFQLVSCIFLILTCGFAIGFGGRPERLVGAASLVAWIATPVVLLRDWFSPQYGVFAIDAGLFAVVLACALRSDRFWPMPAAALALIPVMVHIAFVVDLRIWPWASFYANGACSWLELIVLVAGTWFEVASPSRRRGPMFRPAAQQA